MVDFARFEDPFSRRTMLANMLQGLALSRAEPPADPGTGKFFHVNGDYIGLPGGFLAVELYAAEYWDPAVEDVPPHLTLVPGFGWAGVRQAHRSEAIPAALGPDPEPLDTHIEGEVYPIVVRHWAAGSTATCRQCERCNACPSAQRPGQEVCLVPFDRYEGPSIAAAPEPEPEPEPRFSRAEQKYQSRLAAIKRRNAIRRSHERRKARDLAFAGMETAGSGT